MLIVHSFHSSLVFQREKKKKKKKNSNTNEKNSMPYIHRLQSFNH